MFYYLWQSLFENSGDKMTFRNDKKSKKDITLLTNCPMCTLVRYSSGAQYGNTGCRIFKWVGGTKLERFLLKNQRGNY